MLCQSTGQYLLAINHQFPLVSLKRSDVPVHVVPSGLKTLVGLCQGLGSMSGWRPGAEVMSVVLHTSPLDILSTPGTLQEAQMGSYYHRTSCLFSLP